MLCSHIELRANQVIDIIFNIKPITTWMKARIFIKTLNALGLDRDLRIDDVSLEECAKCHLFSLRSADYWLPLLASALLSLYITEHENYI